MLNSSKTTKNKTSLNVTAHLDEDGRMRLSSKDDPYKKDGMVIEVGRRTDAYGSLMSSLGYEKTLYKDSPEFTLNSEKFASKDERLVPVGVDTYGFTVYWDIRYGHHLNIEGSGARGPSGRTSMVKNILEHVRRNPETTEAYVFSPKSTEEYGEYDSVENIDIFSLDYSKLKEISYSYYEKFENILSSRQPRNKHKPVEVFKETFLIVDSNEGLSEKTIKNIFDEDEDDEIRMMGDPQTSISSIMTHGRQGKFSIVSTSRFSEEHREGYPLSYKPTRIYLGGPNYASQGGSSSYFGRIFDSTKSPEFKVLFPNYSESL